MSGRIGRCPDILDGVREQRTSGWEIFSDSKRQALGPLGFCHEHRLVDEGIDIIITDFHGKDGEEIWYFLRSS